MRRVRSWRERVGLAVAGLLVGLLAFEVLVQLIACGLWATGSREAGRRATEEGPVVLCIGDSNTYGVGASTRAGSYPSRLECWMRDELGAGQVVNAGWPGNSSRDVLLGLPAQLRAHRPDYVYVLVGTNDLWSLPSLTRREDLGAAPGFPLRWRTGRLLALAASWLRGEAEVAVDDGAPPPFVGRWHDVDTGTPLVISVDGRFVLDQHELWWTADSESLRVMLPNGLVSRSRWQRTSDRLVLHVEGGSRHEYASGPGPRRRESGSNVFFDVASNAVDRAGGDAAFDALCRVIEAAPTDPLSWRRLGTFQLQERHWRRLEVIIEAALARVQQPKERAVLLRGLCLLPHVGTERKLACVLQAAAADGLEGPVLEFLRRHRAAISRASFQTAVEGVECDGATRRALQGLFDAAWDPARGYVVVLDKHLRMIVEICRDNDAEPVLVGYPRRKPEIDRVLGGVAEDLGTGVVWLSGEFEEKLRAIPPADLFAPDGHCNDAGYEIVTRLVARDLEARIARRRGQK